MGKITKASTLLANAHDLLEHGKWTKGCLLSSRGAMCADGALQVVAGMRMVDRKTDDGTTYQEYLPVPKHNQPAYEEAVRLLSLTVAPDGYACNNAIWSWNDSKVKSKKAVLKKFKEAEAEAIRQERQARKQKVAA